MRTLYQGGIRLLVQARLALGSQALQKSMGIVEDVANDIKLCKLKLSKQICGRDFSQLRLQGVGFSAVSIPWADVRGQKVTFA